MTKGYIHALEMATKQEEEATAQDFFNWAYKKIFYPQSEELPFWAEVNAIKGTGYRMRVIFSYESFLREHNADVILGEIIQNHEKALFASVIDLL